MKAVIITGVSGGLGKAFFDLFIQDSTYLLGISRRFLPDQEKLANQHPDRIRLLQKDLADVTGGKLTDAQLTSELGNFLAAPDVDEVILINNAAVVEPIGAVGELDSDKILHAIHVNIAAPILLINTVLAIPEITEKKITVLQISSGAAKRPIDGWALYCATKAGSEMFVDVVNEQFRGNPRVSLHNVNPGVMDTDMQNKIRNAFDVHFPTRDRFVSLKEEGKLPSPAEVAMRIAEEYIRKPE